MILNLDAIKKNLSAKNRMTSSETTPSSEVKNDVVQVVSHTKNENGINLVSLDHPNIKIEKQSSIKLVSLDKKEEEKEQPQVIQIEQENSQISQEESVILPEETVSQPIVSEEHIFNNLSVDSEKTQEQLQKEYEHYKKLKRKKMIQTISYSFATIMILLVGVFFYSDITRFVENTMISMFSSDKHVEQYHATEMYVTGDQLLETLQENINISMEEKLHIESLLSGKEKVETATVLSTLFPIAGIQILIPVDPMESSNAFSCQYALAHNLIIDESACYESLSVGTVQKIIEFMKQREQQSVEADMVFTSSGSEILSNTTEDIIY